MRLDRGANACSSVDGVRHVISEPILHHSDRSMPCCSGPTSAVLIIRECIIGGINMQRFFLAIALMAGTWLAAFPSPAQAAPCLLVTLTGTMSGPVLLNGVAGAGTLVRYGDDSGDCSAVKLQFDAGRGTALRLSQVNLDVGSLTRSSSRTCIPTTPRALPISCRRAGTGTPRGQGSTWSAARTHHHRSASR
jgi:hypothetical protein